MVVEKIITMLEFVNNNWGLFMIILALIFSIYVKVKGFIKLTPEQKIDIAKKAIKENILAYISDSEKTWLDYKKTGQVKRSEVISKIYNDYPILKEYINQEELIEFIDSLIDESLPEVNKIFNNK